MFCLGQLLTQNADDGVILVDLAKEKLCLGLHHGVTPSLHVLQGVSTLPGLGFGLLASHSPVLLLLQPLTYSQSTADINKHKPNYHQYHDYMRKLLGLVGLSQLFEIVLHQELMNQLTRQLNRDLVDQSHCCHHQQPTEEEFDIPVIYRPEGVLSLTPVKSFLSEDDHEQDLMSKLLRYNPSLALYLNSSAAIPSTYRYPEINVYKPSEDIHTLQQASNNSQPEQNIVSYLYQQEERPYAQIIDNPVQDSGRLGQVSEQKMQEYLECKRDTRQMADSKFRKYFGKPCFATYGAYNIQVENGGVIYGEYMKTHNVSPHKHGNKPSTYQTYEGALLHANRAIVNNNNNREQIARQIIHKEKQEQPIRSRKPSLIPHDGLNKSTSQLREYNQSMNRSILSKQGVKEKDRHIEEHQQKNYEDKQKYNYPDHYLVPAVQTPPVKSQNPAIGKKIKSSHVVNNKLQKEQGEKEEHVRRQTIDVSNQAPQELQPKRFQIVQLSHAETQTMSPLLVKADPGSTGKQVKIKQSLVAGKVTTFTPKQSPKVLENNGEIHPMVHHLSSESPLPLQSAPAYSYEQEDMKPPYDYCLHKQCQQKTKVKKAAFQKGIEDPDVADRLISIAKKAAIYNNYLPQQPTYHEQKAPHRHSKVKNYYDLPMERMNPQNYSCQQNQELSQVPYAGKPRRYNLNQ